MTRDLKYIRTKCWDARNKWLDIGLELDLEKSTLDSIQERFKSNERCFIEMLDTWLKNSPKPTLSKLVAALRHITVGFHQLAEELKRTGFSRHGGISQGIEPVVSEDPQLNNLTFPIVDDIKDEQIRDELEERLQYETSEIIDKFKILRQAFFDTLEDCQKDQRDCISRYTRYLKEYLGEKNMKVPKNISKIHTIIQEHSDFFNYEFLVFMIKLAGTEKDKERCEEYLAEFHAYAKRRIFECPSKIGDNVKPGDTKLVVKLDSYYEKYSAEEIKKFRQKLSKILSINAHSLQLKSIKKGCITLVYASPWSVQKVIFPLSADQEALLQEIGVLQLTCNTYQYIEKVHIIETLYVILITYSLLHIHHIDDRIK